MTTVKLVPDVGEQVAAIVSLVNLAYRGDSGWTRETAIVAGKRASRAEIEHAIDDPGYHLLVHCDNAEMLACVCIDQQNEKVGIGLLAVHPRLQGRGFGGAVLATAETYAVSTLGTRTFVIAVVAQRPELIAWYERRAYVQTGEIAPYPVHLGVGKPRTADLGVVYLEKVV